MKVLLATDGSKYSTEAAWLLSRLPHRDPLELTILTVVSPPMVAFYSPTKPFMDRIIQEDRRFAEAQQAKVREMFTGADATMDALIVQGDPQECIVAQATKLDADLVVIGAKGHSQIDRILLGSTSDFVATHSHCSVLVVRPTGLADAPHRNLRITVAYDDSGASQAALAELFKFDLRTHTDVTVVSVAGYNPVFNPEFGFNPETLQREAANAVKAAKQQLQGKVQTVHDEVIDHDHVAEGLVRFTEDKHSDCIVIGDSGRSTLARTLLGSVSRYVLRHARCSVWITRNRNVEGPAKNQSGKAGRLAGAS